MYPAKPINTALTEFYLFEIMEKQRISNKIPTFHYNYNGEPISYDKENT